MNRILFLPLDKNLLYFAFRALMKGHLPLFKRRGLDVGKSSRTDLRMDGYFLPNGMRVMTNKEHGLYCRWFDFWFDYFDRQKVTHLVTDIETNISVIAALDVAKEREEIITSYVMHGEGDIYHFTGHEGWYRNVPLDHFYARSSYYRDYLRRFGVDYGVRKFNRKVIDTSKIPKYFPERKTVVYAPVYAGQLEVNKYISSSLASHEFRYRYNNLILAVLIGSGHKVLWCHDPKLDYDKNVPEYFAYLEAAHNLGKIKWIKDRAPKYLKKADAAMSDIGSSFFFEAINAGKPVMCLYHRSTAPRLKLGTEELFGGCLQPFVDFEGLEIKLKRFLNEKVAWKYVPWKYIAQEKDNDELIWEKK